MAPPLGLLRDFVLDDDDGRTMDLKKSGARLFVDAARVMALSTGTGHTSTALRLRNAGSRLNMRPEEIAGCIEGFFFIQTLRLRNQVAASGSTVAVNRIDPEALNEVDRRVLRESLRQARKLQDRIKLDYQL
jgi:CBS domain-containing protein